VLITTIRQLLWYNFTYPTRFTHFVYTKRVEPIDNNLKCGHVQHKQEIVYAAHLVSSLFVAVDQCLNARLYIIW